MSEFEMDFGQQLLDMIASQIGEEGLKEFIRDFHEWAECVLDDEEYVEVDDSDSSTEEEDDDDEPQSIIVDEEYETEVDDEGFHSLKDCVVKQK